MKPIIIRKPKFMRNDAGMDAYLFVFKTIEHQLRRPAITPKLRSDLMRKRDECLHKAAKAGGFRNVDDLNKWLKAKATE